MDKKKQSRMRRARRARAKIRQLEMNRLSVHRTANHMYAQIISPCGAKVLAAASSLEKEVKSAVSHTGNREAATLVGQLIAKRAKEANLTSVAFDRSGFKYHGRVKALAEAAREGGIQF